MLLKGLVFLFCFLLLEAQSSRFPTGENNLPQMANIQCKCVRHLASVSCSCQNPIIPAINLSFVVGSTTICRKWLRFYHRSSTGIRSGLSGVFTSVKTFLVHNLFCQPAGRFWIVTLLEALPTREFFTNKGKECVL